MAARTVVTVRLRREDLDTLPPNRRSGAILDLVHADIVNPGSIGAVWGGLNYGEAAGSVSVSIPADLLPEVSRRRGPFSIAAYIRELIDPAHPVAPRAPTTRQKMDVPAFKTVSARPTTLSRAAGTPTSRAPRVVGVVAPRRRGAAERRVGPHGVKGKEHPRHPVPPATLQKPIAVRPVEPQPVTPRPREPAYVEPVVTMHPAVGGTSADLRRWRERARDAEGTTDHVVGVWRPLLVVEQFDFDAERALDRALRTMVPGRSAALIVGMGAWDGEPFPMPTAERQVVGDLVEQVAVGTCSGFDIRTTAFEVLAEGRPEEGDDTEDDEVEEPTVDPEDVAGWVMLFVFRRVA